MSNRPDRPSAFLVRGFPSCSIFGEAWHEVAAVVYLKALVALGDTWQLLDPPRIRTALRGTPLAAGEGPALHDTVRLRRVAAVLTSAEDARKFSRVWA